MPEANMKLNLFSGNKPREGYVNLDGQKLPGTDVVAWIDPWYPKLPFPDDSFEEIEADNSVEHLANTHALLREFLRISKDGAKWHIKTPGWQDPHSWDDPTHLAHWGWEVLEFYTEQGYDGRNYLDGTNKCIAYTRTGAINAGLEFFAIVYIRGTT